jgi:hypothetical protein
MNTEILNGLSIEELEERAEFTSAIAMADVAAEYSADQAVWEAEYYAGKYWETGCTAPICN